MSYGAGIRGDRGRTRGGKDQFDWEDVKNDPNRQRYLGNSLHASVGRWQENKDLTWWNENGGNGSGSSGSNNNTTTARSAQVEARRQEMAEIRYNEEVARCNALGLPFPPKPAALAAFDSDGPPHPQQLSERERSILLKRKTSDDDDADRITNASARLVAKEDERHTKKLKKSKKKKKKSKKSKKKKRKKSKKSSSSSSGSGSETESENESFVDGSGGGGSATNEGDAVGARVEGKKSKKRKLNDQTGDTNNEEELLRQAMQYLEQQQTAK